MNSSPKESIIFFDLNGVLIHRIHFDELDDDIKEAINSSKITEFSLNQTIYKKVKNYFIALRPYAKEILTETMKYHQIGIWTTSNKKNVENILKFIKSELHDTDINFDEIPIFDSTKCDISEIKDENGKPYSFKNINGIKTDCSEYGINPNNIFVIDDDPVKLANNDEKSCLTVRKWEGQVDDIEFCRLIGIINYVIPKLLV